MTTQLQEKDSSTLKILHPPFNDISPYFSAVIYRIHENISLKRILGFAKIECNRENRDSTRHFYYFNETYLEDKIGVFTICQKSIPTWLTSRKISRSKTDFPIWEDYKTHLAILYISGNYLFVSAKDAKIMSFFQLALSKIDPSIISIVQKDEFQKARAFHGEEAKIIGLKNTFGFGGGGKIPESKSYTGKDCSRSLNGVTDHIFRLSHIGASDKEKGYSGASMKKRKVWGGWTNSLEDFKCICDEYSLALTDEIYGEEIASLKCLAQPSSIDLIKDRKPIMFRLESWIKGKGVLALKYEDQPYKSWNTEIPQYDNDIIQFQMWIDKSKFVESRIRFFFNEENKVQFEYAVDNKLEPNVVFFQEDDVEPRGRDLVKYLNSSGNYTFLFPNGIAYSEGDCYKIDKLSHCFFDKASSEIDWGDVDITKEEKRAVHPKINILQKLEIFSAKLPGLYFAANDNGANEVADLVLLLKNKIVFVHAKYSKKPISGLRIEDLQEVASQAVKNVNFSVPAPYSDNQVERLYANSFYNPDDLDMTTFKETFFRALDDINIRKEVWIVQPGISKNKLEKNDKNKAHTLLSYTEVVLNAAQIDLRFYCSP